MKYLEGTPVGDGKRFLKNEVMKVFGLILFCFSFLGCNDDQSELIDLMNAGLNTGEKTNRIFLDLEFGQSRDFVESKLKDLEKKNKLSFTGDNYEYEFPSSNKLHSIKWLVQPVFHNDTLIEVSVFSYEKTWRGNTISGSDAFSELIRQFSEKYGDPLIVNGTRYHWVDNNLLIYIHKQQSDMDALGDGLHITYWDIPPYRYKRNNPGDIRYDDNTILDSYDLWYYDSLKVSNLMNDDI